MTRLNTNDIQGISARLMLCDLELKKLFGFTLEDVARRAVKIPNNFLNQSLKTAVVPITSGIGIIEGFSQTVCDILKYCHADVFVTERTDVAGIQEAYQKEADLIFMADDEVYAAFSLNKKITSDNGYATGIAFAAALEMMMEKVIGEEVLILGLGPVGTAAAQYISDIGAVAVCCDLQEEKAVRVAKAIPLARVEKSLKSYHKYTYIIDATTSAGFIKEKDVSENTIISAPGMPLGVTEEAEEKVVIFHNPLELGIMTMYFDCIHQLYRGELK